MERTTQLLPLGLQRLRLLDCLGGTNPHASGYFQPAAGTDIFTAFHHYVTYLTHAWATESDPTTISLLAAARFLTGDLAAAAVILDHLPVEAAKLDHGAGICLVMPLYALKTGLPLPAELTETNRWLAGSADQAALRAWLAENGHRLFWIEAAGVYHLGLRR